VSKAANDRLEAALSALVPVGEQKVAFGKITVAQAREQARSLKEIGNFGPLMRVAKVAMGWSQLAALLDQRTAKNVSELDEGTIVDFAERLWVIPPEGGLI
jgi:hypothetical protein